MDTNKNNIFKKYQREIIVVLSVIILLVIGVAIFRNCGGKNDRDYLTIIDNVMPKEELYVMSTIMEDYTIRNQSELFENHKCVQIVEEQVGYKISLNEISYEVLSGDSILVSMPEPEYYASTQQCKFYSDDEDFWKGELSNKNELISEVKEKIKERFNTPNRLRQAKNVAKESVSLILTQLDLIPVFTDISVAEKN